MRLFETPGADGAYDRWQEPNSKHTGDCECSGCHNIHIEENLVQENALDYNMGCCQEQMEDWFQSGKKCRKHPRSAVTDATAETNFQRLCDWCLLGD